jgi:hypothetical protein
MVEDLHDGQRDALWRLCEKEHLHAADGNDLSRRCKGAEASGKLPRQAMPATQVRRVYRT